MFREYLADVMVSLGDRREVRNDQWGAEAQRCRWQNEAQTAGVASCTPTRQGTGRPIDLWIMEG